MRNTQVAQLPQQWGRRRRGQLEKRTLMKLGTGVGAGVCEGGVEG